MKKILLGTAALVGTAVMAQGAAAQVTVKFGGDIRFDAAWIDDDQPNSKDFNFQQEVRFPITAEGKSDNGLTYGAFVRLRNTGSTDIAGSPGGAASVAATTGNNIYAERKYIYVGGGFGRIEMGDEWGAHTKLTGFAPVVGIGQIDGNHGNWTNNGSFAYQPSNYNTYDTKITYFTPRIAGFQAGASYTPEYGQRGDINQVTRRIKGAGYTDVIELAANYSGEFSGATVNVGAGYSFGDRDTNALREMEIWNVSASVGYAGFTVGGAYIDNEIGAVDQDGWNVGATYKNGPMGVGISYGTSETNGVDDTVWSVGAVYTVAPGLNVAADLYFVDADNASYSAATYGTARTGNDATILMFRTQLLF